MHVQVEGCMYECKDAHMGMEMGARLQARMHMQSKDGVCGCMKGAKMGRTDARTQARMGCKDKVHAQDQRWDAWMHTCGGRWVQGCTYSAKIGCEDSCKDAPKCKRWGTRMQDGMHG